MIKNIIKIFLKIARILFFVSFVVGVGIDAFYKFQINEGMRGYKIALIGYVYFCFYLAILLSGRIIKKLKPIIKIIIYVCLLAGVILIFNYIDKLPISGFLESCLLILLFTSFFIVLVLTLYYLFCWRKIILGGFLIVAAIIVVIWLVLAKNIQDVTTNEAKNTEYVADLIQPWQLNSHYKIDAVVKFLKVDLDNDGKEELAAITSYDKLKPDVFYYAGFYRYNPVTEVWDEFYGEELNILNYGIANTSGIEDVNDFNQKIIEMWSTEFTTLKNVGDITGDGCPEIVFSSLIQGEYFDNYIIVAQAGKSHYRFKIFGDQRTMAEIVAEDGMLIEKYSDEKNNVKDIYEWDIENLYFKLIESQKTKKVVKEIIKTDSILEPLTG